MTVTIGRRELLAALGGSAAAWPLVARAQQPASKIPRIGIIGDPAISGGHFPQGLHDLGYIEGRNVTIEYRPAERPDRLIAAAMELAQLPMDIIVSLGSPATQAAKQATTTIPIVMVAIGDPVRAGFVASLAQPGGNITGNSILGPPRARLTASRAPREKVIARRG